MKLYAVCLALTHVATAYSEVLAYFFKLFFAIQTNQVIYLPTLKSHWVYYKGETDIVYM